MLHGNAAGCVPVGLCASVVCCAFHLSGLGGADMHKLQYAVDQVRKEYSWNGPADIEEGIVRAMEWQSARTPNEVS